MTMTTFPTVYVSHGSPMVMLNKTPAHDFLAGFGRELGKPKAIVIATAHFTTRRPVLTGDEHPEMIYDFGGFPQPLFEMKYPAPGSPDIAIRGAQMLVDAGIDALPVQGRGFDHGTWVPLKLMYPDADIPVVQLAVQPDMSVEHHVKMGRALAPLREEGILIMGSGSVTHNLYELMKSPRIIDAPVPDWVSGFGNWVHDRVEAGDLDDLTHYRERGPFAKENHPSEEHYLPLPLAMAAAGEGAKGKRVHTSGEYGLLMMDAYAFG